MAATRRVHQPRSRAAAAAPPRTRTRQGGGGARARLAPTRQSLLVGLALLALGAGAYVVAGRTSIFAITAVEVTGAPPAVQAQVGRALAPFVGRSLVGLDGAAVLRRAEELPAVVSARVDRAFPHTLRVAVVPERPVAVLREGRSSWLVSARGRVVSSLARHAEPALPRIWAPAALSVEPGAFLPPDRGGVAAQALAAARRFPEPIRTATFAHGLLAFRLRSGLDLRLGDPTDIRLKLAVARRVLPLMPGGETYLDVSLPSRPVSGSNSQLSGGG